MKILLLFIGLMTVSQSGLAKEALGLVKAVKGQVNVLRGKESLALKKNDQVFKNDLVSTDRKSLVLIQLNDKSMLKLGAVSKLRMQPPRSQKGLNLITGSLFAKVRKKILKKEDQQKVFKVRTRTAVAGVRGTEFFTSYGTDKSASDIWLCVNEGSVEVQQEGEKKKVLVNAGEGISVRRKQGISAPRPLPWTRKLNWNMEADKGDLVNTVNIEEAYSDLLDEDYD